MPTLWNFPIEPLELRYSKQWDTWFRQQLPQHMPPHWDVVTITGYPVSKYITTGAFLDVINTQLWKASQLTAFLHNVHAGRVQSGDVCFFHDAWYPGVEMLAYVRECSDVKLRLYGCLHAGSYDPHDFLARHHTQPWAAPFETALAHIYDGIFFATHYHRALYHSRRAHRHADMANKLRVTGWPLDREQLRAEVEEELFREHTDRLSTYRTPDPPYRIVFPHRLDDEKNPLHFDALISRLADDDHWHDKVQPIVTMRRCDSKLEYYRHLIMSHVAVSFAEQETFGIAMAEAAVFGCIPIAPNHLAYPELYPRELLYEWDNNQHRCVENALVVVTRVLSDVRYYQEEFMPKALASGLYPNIDNAIPTMCKIMRGEE